MPPQLNITDKSDGQLKGVPPKSQQFQLSGRSIEKLKRELFRSAISSNQIPHRAEKNIRVSSHIWVLNFQLSGSSGIQRRFKLVLSNRKRLSDDSNRILLFTYFNLNVRNSEMVIEIDAYFSFLKAYPTINTEKVRRIIWENRINLSLVTNIDSH